MELNSERFDCKAQWAVGDRNEDDASSIVVAMVGHFDDEQPVIFFRDIRDPLSAFHRVILNPAHEESIETHLRSGDELVLRIRAPKPPGRGPTGKVKETFAVSLWKKVGDEVEIAIHQPETADAPAFSH